MNKTIKKIVSFLCLTVFVMSIAVMNVGATAAEPDAAVNLITFADPSQDKIDITVNPDANDSWITVAITDDEGYPLAVFQQKVDETNNIVFPLTGVTSGEDLIVRVSTSPSDKSKVFTRKYYTFAQQQQAMDDIMDPTMEITQEVADVISLELEGDFNLINSTGIIFLKEQLSIQFEGQDTIEVQTFINALNEKISLSILSGQDEAVIKSYMENEKTELGIASLPEYEWYDNLEETEKMTKIVSKLATKTYTSITGFADAFKAENFLDEMSTKHSSDIVDFIRTNATNQANNGVPFTINWTGYDALQPGQQEYFTGLIAGVRYETLTAFASDFISKVSAASLYVEQQETTPPTIPGITTPGTQLGTVGGGGGGFGGTTGTGTQTPVVPPVETPSSGSFKDVSTDHWANEAIEALYKEGVINGVDAENFAPEELITREQYVKIIVGAFGIAAEDSSATSFADVPEDQWYSEFIKAAVNSGIINGISDDEFGVGENISRQDMAVIIYRTAKILGIELTAKTTDVPADIDSVAEYAREAVTALYQAGIINGVGEGKFAPADTATRAQAAKIIYGLKEGM